MLISDYSLLDHVKTLKNVSNLMRNYYKFTNFRKSTKTL